MNLYGDMKYKIPYFIAVVISIVLIMTCAVLLAYKFHISVYNPSPVSKGLKTYNVTIKYGESVIDENGNLQKRVIGFNISLENLGNVSADINGYQMLVRRIGQVSWQETDIYHTGTMTFEPNCGGSITLNLPNSELYVSNGDMLAVKLYHDDITLSEGLTRVGM